MASILTNVLKESFLGGGEQEKRQGKLNTGRFDAGFEGYHTPKFNFWKSKVAECESVPNPDITELLRRVTKLESSASTDARLHGVDVVLGAQWGDEGKGKLVDQLTEKYDICARVAGGSNAGHTIVVDGVKYKFHLVPSGMLNPNAVCLVGNGVVVHVPTLMKELEDLDANGINWRGRFFVSDRAHIVFDFHQEVDAQNENRLGRNFIGTTKKGIGPAYSSKINRNGVRFCDLQDFAEFERKTRLLAATFQAQYPNLKPDVEKEIEYYRTVHKQLQEMTIDTIEYVNQAYFKGKKILIEGANAIMLDIDFGTYPYVTSSNPSIGSVCTGMGVSPNKINNIWGVVKAYCTRVGEGPFPTELHCEIGERIRDVGAEYGTTTGRPRRCGWLDIPQMKYSIMINGFDSLMMTKLDCLTGLNEIRIGTRYVSDGKVLKTMPSNLQVFGNVVVEYEILPGWKEDISKAKKWEDLPDQAQAYVLRVEQLLGTPIRWVGVGPSRDAVIDRFAPLAS